MVETVDHCFLSCSFPFTNMCAVLAGYKYQNCPGKGVVNASFKQFHSLAKFLSLWVLVHMFSKHCLGYKLVKPQVQLNLILVSFFLVTPSLSTFIIHFKSNLLSRYNSSLCAVIILLRKSNDVSDLNNYCPIFRLFGKNLKILSYFHQSYTLIIYN